VFISLSFTSYTKSLHILDHLFCILFALFNNSIVAFLKSLNAHKSTTDLSSNELVALLDCPGCCSAAITGVDRSWAERATTVSNVPPVFNRDKPLVGGWGKIGWIVCCFCLQFLR